MDTETIPGIIRRSLNPDFAMDWDFFLACVPLVVAYLLFSRPGKRGLFWWFGLVLFVLFLPNAAYPVTDILHFVLKVRQRPYLPTWAVGLIVVPDGFMVVHRAAIISAAAGNKVPAVAGIPQSFAREAVCFPTQQTSKTFFVAPPRTSIAFSVALSQRNCPFKHRSNLRWW